MAESGKEVEVNGKVDLGARRLLVSHVENATSFFAYTEAEKDFMKSIKLICKEILEQAPKLAEKPVLEQVCLLRNCYDLIPPLVHRRRIKTRISGI